MDPNRIPATGESVPFITDFFIVLGALAALALLIFFWAVAIRKPGRRRHKHRHRHRRKNRIPGAVPNPPSAKAGGPQTPEKSKKPPPPALRK
jgi:hypothetical protein